MHVHTTIIVAKPHVAQYLKKHYQNEGAITIPADTEVFQVIKGNLTNEFIHRITDIPDGMERLDVSLPSGYRSYFASQAEAKQLARSLERIFWREFELYIYKRAHHNSMYLDYAIKAFAAEYEITESIYSIGNFRRQMTRKGIKGMRPELPNVERRISRKLTNQQCKQLWRLRKDRKLSYRTLASVYQISDRQAQNICEKVSRVLSHYFAKTSHNKSQYVS